MDPFEQLLMGSEDAAFAVDARRRVVFWNPACERLLGVPARAALGQPCCEVTRACDASGARFCGPACGPVGLVKGGAAPKPTPLWFSDRHGARQRLWLSILLVPSQWQGLWTVVHVLQRKPRGLVAAPPAAAGATRSRAVRFNEDNALTSRERETLGLLAQGHRVAEIARKLCLSPVTVRNHVQHLIAKLGLHSQLEAVAYAYRNDLV